MEPYINTTVKDESLTEAPQLRGLVAVVISPTPQSYEIFSYIPNKKQEKFHHGRKKHSIPRRKGKKRHPPRGQRPSPAKGGHNGRQPLPAELPRCRLPRWRPPAMVTHKKTGLQFSRRQVHAAHLAARPPHAIHRVPDRARAGRHL